MEEQDSVSQWIDRLKAGDQAVAQPLWERYFQRLVGLARKKMAGAARRAADEEDVVVSAFDSFCRRAQEGQFPQLADRDDLWRLLVAITSRKAANQVRHEHRQKRGGARVRGESVFGGAKCEVAAAGIDQFAADGPSPDFAAQLAEQVGRLLNRLGDDLLRSIALAKLEGFTNQEIAAKLACSLSAVERKLRLIRTLWRDDISE